MNATSIEEPRAPFWLTGNFAPVEEEVTHNELAVTGRIPPELNGRFFRAGPNPLNGHSPHWFLGDGMLHGVELCEGKANWYRNRYVRTPHHAGEYQNVLEGLAGDLRRSLANTHVIHHAGKILALEELHYPYEVSTELETVGPYDFNGALRTGMTAHPKTCAETGELLFFSYGVRPPFLTYHRASADGALVQSETIDVKGATMVHDFNVTRNFVIFMDLPVVFDPAAAANGFPIRWSDDYGARLGVMPRTGRNQDVTWYDIDPCYVYHPMNAYEEGGLLVIDACRFAHEAKADAKPAVPVLYRWVIDGAAGTVSESQLDDAGAEFPRVADSVVGLPYRYGYTAAFGSNAAHSIGFRKYDVQSGTSSFHELTGGRSGGEPVFVAAANGSDEDDGYLLSYVYDPAENESELVILDAGDIESDPIARVHLRARVPAGFHGSWIADTDKSSTVHA